MVYNSEKTIQCAYFRCKNMIEKGVEAVEKEGRVFCSHWCANKDEYHIEKSPSCIKEKGEAKPYEAHAIDWRNGETIICDGCNVNHPFEHRCHGQEAVVMGEFTHLPCQCKECVIDAKVESLSGVGYDCSAFNEGVCEATNGKLTEGCCIGCQCYDGEIEEIKKTEEL